MAEFMYIMEQVRRICYEHSDCEMCPLYKIHNSSGCAFDYYVFDGVSLDEVERKIDAWAKKHPEPAYPTWDEWQNSTFPDAVIYISPCEFGRYDRFKCSETPCDKCMKRQIPADIAEKLGIKPKEAK